MSWHAVRPEDLRALRALLERDESSCVPFTARLASREHGCSVFVEEAGGRIRGCFMHTARGLLLPVVPDGIADPSGMAAALRGLEPEVQSIMGMAACVNAAEALMPLSPTHRTDYRLMALRRDERRPARPPSRAAAGVTVRRAGPEDTLRLYPLQRAYELEEVVISPAHFSPAGCLRLLRQGLRQELVFAAERDGVPVAKAGTNARGWAVDQIGGVFTTPEERRKGISGMVMEALLDAIFAEKAAACLFVKHGNAPAIAVYERLGFATIGSYAIVYYGM